MTSALIETGLDDPRLRGALALAHQAGRRALAARAGVRVAFKGPGDRVTDADLAIQAEVVDGIRASFPADAVVAEEGAAAEFRPSEYAWVVDPIDGTNNYALGIPCFAVSIAVLRSGIPHAGVIHDPNTGFTCFALRGAGAVADGRALALCSRSLGPGSNVAVRVPVDPRLEPLVVDWLRRYKFRGFGSVALHLAYVAIGALDVVVDHQARLWDVAAGAVIVGEAGGAITALDGGALFPAAGRGRGTVPFVAGNPGAHAETLAACRAAWGRGDGR
jgi:myo-inositol-1(or 4)-monophosphatase